jgi:hypothetical protein
VAGRLDESTSNGHIASDGAASGKRMTQILRQAWIRRLVAAAMSLALLVVSTVGAAAHGAGCGHPPGPRGHQHVAMTPSAPAAAVTQHAMHAQDSQGAAGDNQPGTAPTVDPGHGGCLDFMCHCCIALPAGASTWTHDWLLGAADFSWSSRALHAHGPAGFDRPPKSFVTA